MADRIELEDITIEWGNATYIPVDRRETQLSAAKPYFDPYFREEVILNWNGSTTLKFKVYGSSKEEIWGRVTRPEVTTPDAKRTFCIKKPGQASGKAEIECNVVIKTPNADHAGYWLLTIWYKGSPNDKASSRRDVINNSICGGWSCSVQ